MAKVVELSQVPPTFDNEKQVLVCNPTVVEFVTMYKGQEVVLPSGAMEPMTETKGAHVAKHLAIFILNNQSVQFLQKQFPGLTEKGQPKWKMQDNAGFFTRADINELAKSFVVYDYRPGTPLPSLPKVKTKFDNPAALNVLPASEQNILPSEPKTGKGKPEQVESSDEKLSEAEEANKEPGEQVEVDNESKDAPTDGLMGAKATANRGGRPAGKK